LSPWLDMEATGATFETNAQKDLIASRDMIQAMAGVFLGEGGNRRDPLANPLYADLAGLPPIYIQTGADETLLDDSRALAELARKSGVDVTLEVVPEMRTSSNSWPAALRKLTRRSNASLTGSARSWG